MSGTVTEALCLMYSVGSVSRQRRPLVLAVGVIFKVTADRPFCIEIH